MRELLKDIMNAWLMYWVRKFLKKHGAHEHLYTDEQLGKWVEDWGSTIGSQPQGPKEHFHKNYVKIEEVVPEPEKDITKLVDLAEEVGLTVTEANIIHDKCERDLTKTLRVIQMMRLSYQSDDSVIAQYDQLYAQLKHRVK